MLRRAAELVGERRAGDLPAGAQRRGRAQLRHAQRGGAGGAWASPRFACTPDLFPDLMAAAIQKQDLALWAAKNDIVVARGAE